MGIVSATVDILQNELIAGISIAVILAIIGILHITGTLNFFGKKKTGRTVGWIIAITAGLVVLAPQALLSVDLGTSSGDSGANGVSFGAACPDDGDSSLKVDVVNSANETGSEGFDVTYSLYRKGSDGTLERVAKPTDTTSPSATSIDCGSTYVGKIHATDAASGDNSRVMEVLSGPARINSDGDFEFDAASSNINLVLGVDQQATLEARAFDNNQNAFMFDTGDASATNYETDGVTWTSTTNNATKIDESLGFDLTFEVRAVQSDTNWNDKGTYYLVEAPTATWNDPTVRVSGKTLSDRKGDSEVFGPNEQRAWSGYEYVYFTENEEIYDGGDGATVDLIMDPLSGQTCSADVELDIGARGNYESIDGITVDEGGAKDDSGATVVRSLYDMTIDCA